jgi:hypothetical protein
MICGAVAEEEPNNRIRKLQKVAIELEMYRKGRKSPRK